MRPSVLRKSSPIRFSLVLILALMFALALSACGGGGGSSNNNNNQGGGNQGIVVTGKVVNSLNISQGVPNAVVTLNTGQHTTTGADGSFTIPNVPSGATSLIVTSPNLSQYLNLGTYQALYYNMDTGAGSPHCAIPLPTPLHAGFNSVGLVGLYPNPTNSGSPPPTPDQFDTCGSS